MSEILVKQHTWVSSIWLLTHTHWLSLQRTMYCLVCFLEPVSISHQRLDRQRSPRMLLLSHWSPAFWIIVLSISGNPPAILLLFLLYLPLRTKAAEMNEWKGRPCCLADLPVGYQTGKRLRYGGIMMFPLVSFQQPQRHHNKSLQWTIDAIDIIIIWK